MRRSLSNPVSAFILLNTHAAYHAYLKLGVNSVRFSIRIKQADEIEHILVHKFTRFLTQVRLYVKSASSFADHNLLARRVILYPSEEAHASTYP
jgi:hypothetical protein